MTTIELTPDVVFERADSVVSPSPAYWGPTSTTPRPKSKPKPYSRGYHSVGSATLPTRGRKGGKDGSQYGIMISIKDIKGHPFVVLEDKDKQKHMVQAPENEGNSSVLSSEGYNGFTPEPEDDTNFSISDVNPPLSDNFKRHASPSPVPRLRSRESGREYGGRQKISTAAKARSRSVPPGRAGYEKKQQRARSVSPPRRENSAKPVDSERIKPVKGLIGFFEATSPVENSTHTFPKPTKTNSVPPVTTSKIREVSNRMNSQRVVSPTSTVSISSVNSSVDVSHNSRRSNLRVTTVESPTDATKKPEGRYFAVTSPGALQSKGTFTLPRLTNIQKPVDYAPPKGGNERLPRSLSTEPYEPKSHVQNTYDKSFGQKAYDKSYTPTPFMKSQDKLISKPPKVDPSEQENIWEPRKRPSYLPSYQRNLQAGDSFPRRKQAPDQSDASNQSNDGTKKFSAPSNINASNNVGKPQQANKVTKSKQTGNQTPKKEDQIIAKTVTTPEESSPASTHVSKAKFIGPSQMLLNKTRRKRSARKLSTAMSESEYSESEFSDAESLKLGEDAYKSNDNEDFSSLAADKEVSSITVAAPQSVTPEPNDELIKQLGHRRTPSIKFEKITSEDVTKKVDRDEVDSSALDEEKKRANDLEGKLKKANDKIRDLSGDISRLESKLKKADCDIEIKHAENGLLQREVDRLKKELEEALSSDEEEKQSLLSLQRNLRIAKRETSALEETITLLESQKSTLKSQLQDARREREDGEVQIRALKHEIEKYQSKSTEQERGVEGARKELSRAKRQAEAQIQDLENQLEKAEQKCHDLQLENSTLEKQLYELKHQQLANENEDIHFNETIQQLEQSKLKALQDLEAANVEIDQKSRALREAERKNNNLQEELRRMDKEMEEELKERESTLLESRQLDQRVKDMKAQQQVANREIEMLKKELENAKSKDKASDVEVEALQDMLDKKEQKLDSLAKKNKALQKQIEDETAARLDQDFEGLALENQRLSKDVAELQKQLRETDIEFMATKDALDDLRKDFRKATDEAERERHKASEIDGNAQEMKEDYDKMKSTLEQREQALKNAREAIGKIEDQMKGYEESHSQAEKEKHLLEADRDETMKEMETLKERVDSQNKQIEKANKTIKDLRDKLAEDMKSSLDGIERLTEMKKEVQRLQSIVDEKSQQVFAAEETIYRQKEVIEEMSAIQENAKKATLEEMEKFMATTEKQFAELRKELERKNDEVKRLESEKRDLEEELDELEQQNPHYDDDHEKEEELVNLSQKLREEEDEKRQLLARLQTTQDKLGNALNEIEVQRSRAQILLEEKLRHDDNVEDLHDQIRDLEDKLDQEAVELNNIKAHHVKTEMKLRDVLKQAQEETDKAISEKELLVVRNDALEKQVEEGELALKMAEKSKRDIENDLQQQMEANYKLQQTLSALGIGHSPGGTDGQGSLLTSV